MPHYQIIEIKLKYEKCYLPEQAFGYSIIPVGIHQHL